MTFAQINGNSIINIIDLEDASLIPLFSEGYDNFIQIDTLAVVPSIGWQLDQYSQLFYPPYGPAIDSLNTQVAAMPTTSVVPIPQVVANGVTYTVSDNTQVVYALQMVTQSGGIIMTNGTGALVWVK